jgi:hypothetical protein
VILDRQDIIDPVSSIMRLSRAAVCCCTEYLDVGTGERFTGFSPKPTDYWMRIGGKLFPSLISIRPQCSALQRLIETAELECLRKFIVVKSHLGGLVKSFERKAA